MDGRGPGCAPAPHLTSDPSALQPRHLVYKNHPSEQWSKTQPITISGVQQKITRTNPPQINTDLARSQAAAMAKRPETPSRPDSKMQRHADAWASSLVNPTSSLLQDLIKEQRATRGSRKIALEAAGDGTSTPPPTSRSHEETSSEKQRKLSNALPTGLKRPQEMGIREMDQYVSKMNKLNFDLKLEIFHRAQQMAAMEKKLERMQDVEQELERMHNIEDELEELREVEENNERLRGANEQLRQELDKRDQAISEAVELICQLEAKIDTLRASRSDSRTSTPRLPSRNGPEGDETGAAEISTPKAQIIVDIPDRTSSKRGTAGPPRRPPQAPSFLREENRSTATLRSLYAADENLSFRSLGMQSTAEPGSPRLSVLSECSYLSPYDPPPEFDGADQLNMSSKSVVEEPGDGMTESKLAHIARWIQPQEETVRSTVPKSRRRAFSDVSRGGRVAESGFDGVLRNKGPHSAKPHPLEAVRSHHSIFGGKLPPTPDTMSTSRPGAGNSSDPSIITDKLRSNGPSLDSPFTERRKLGDRPRSAGDISARPSTAISSISGSLETTLSEITQGPLDADRRSEEVGLFPSFDYFARGTTFITHALRRGRQRHSLHIDDLTFDEQGAKSIISKIAQSYPSSPRSTTSEPRSMWQSSSPPLSPQDWLEAALPARPNRRSKRDRTKKDLATEEPRSGFSRAPESRPPVPARALGGEALLPRSESQQLGGEEPQLPRTSVLRLRPWGNNPEQMSESQGRRRLSLRPRFFGRSNTNAQRAQQPLKSDPVDRSAAPSPVTPKARELIITRHRRADSNPNSFRSDGGPGNSSATDVDEGNREHANRVLPRALAELRSSSQASKRPMTSGSADTSKRRGSLGFLGWMKGASGFGSQTNKDVDAPFALRGTITTEKEKAPRSSAQPAGAAAGRPNSALAGTANAGAETAGSPPKRKSSSGGPPEDEPDWRSRRRSRRTMAS